MKIYLANSLTHAPEAFKTEMEILKRRLKEQYEVLEYFGLAAGEPAEIYSHDMKQVNACDLVLAEVSYPSLGVGFEIATALDLGKRVLAAAKHEAKVGRIIVGISRPNFTFIRYSSADEILKHLE